MSDKLPRFVQLDDEKLGRLEQFWIYTVDDSPKLVTAPIVGDEKVSQMILEFISGNQN